MAEIPAADFGPNHSEVAAFIALLPTLSPGQWGSRQVWWDPNSVAEREVVADRASMLAIAWGQIEAYDSAGSVAWDSTVTALAVILSDLLSPREKRDYINEAAMEASIAAQALVVRPWLSSEQFETLFFPMPLAGVDADLLVQVEGFGPNSASVKRFIELQRGLSPELFARAGISHGAAGRTIEVNRAWNEAWIAAQESQTAAGRSLEWLDAVTTAFENSPLESNTWDEVAWIAAVSELGAADPVQLRADAVAAIVTTVGALVVRDVISNEQFELLCAPMRAVGLDVGEIA